MATRQYTVGFAGARDSYQVPLALAEAGLLSRFVTDFYAPDWIRARDLPGLQRLGYRHQSSLSSHYAVSSYKVLMADRGGVLRRLALKVSSARDGQELLSRAVLKTAMATNSNLLLYAGNAQTAFSHSYSREVKKILFMYHPHIELSSSILLEDMGQHPEVQSELPHLEKDMLDRRVDEELAIADHIICASSFTARSILHIGIPQRKITVIPYGVDSVSLDKRCEKPSGCCNFLFVGSGVQRKGLHVLCKAWSKLRLPNAHLTIIARNIDPAISCLIPENSATLLRGVSSKQLEEEYQRAHVFVMPSLVEGFGYVYLEAMRNGCYCIGTNNTGLPDIGCSHGIAETVRPGSVADLQEALSRAAEKHLTGECDSHASRLCANQYPWLRFRESLVGLLA